MHIHFVSVCMHAVCMHVVCMNLWTHKQGFAGKDHLSHHSNEMEQVTHVWTIPNRLYLHLYLRTYSNPISSSLVCVEVS